MTDRTALVDRVAQHVHDAAQRGATHRHLDRVAGVVHFGAAAQAVGRAQRNRAHDAVAELLLHFQRQGRAIHLEGVVHLGHLVARKFHVDHGADTLNNLALNLSHSLLQYLNRLTLLQTAAAPATISDSSLVIAAWRVLL